MRTNRSPIRVEQHVAVKKAMSALGTSDSSKSTKHPSEPRYRYPLWRTGGTKSNVTWTHMRAHRSRILVKYLYYRISGYCWTLARTKCKDCKMKNTAAKKYNKIMKTLFNIIYWFDCICCRLTTGIPTICCV